MSFFLKLNEVVEDVKQSEEWEKAADALEETVASIEPVFTAIAEDLDLELYKSKITDIYERGWCKNTRIIE